MQRASIFLPPQRLIDTVVFLFPRTLPASTLSCNSRSRRGQASFLPFSRFSISYSVLGLLLQGEGHSPYPAYRIAFSKQARSSRKMATYESMDFPILLHSLIDYLRHRTIAESLTQNHSRAQYHRHLVATYLPTPPSRSLHLLRDSK